MDHRIPSWIRSRKLSSLALIMVGGLLLAYVASQYGQMYMEQRRLAELWQQEQQQLSSPTSEQAHVVKDDGMIRLVIPKIELTSFVVEGTNHHSLLLGPGHMTHTSEPGELGNAVITGHRDTFFRHIHELEKGDQIYVDRGGQRFIYEVTGKKIVDPNDLSVTRPTNDSQMTLITCYPTYYIGPAPKRLVVFTKLASQQVANLSEDDTPKSTPHVESIGAGIAH
jgi:LPXTG-site transpeptidase (sortase) family protein